ncbi:hypothetical protein GCM10010213_19370 [Microbacterium maritypicum]|uniref:PIN domain-containing protein n=2 Tax=Microbacterium maritypicum TaxID=33918 RepID=A0A4Y4B468_MICMQ|nr:hypothetical protein MLI01_15100 [Microbacterium liquefaciens]GGV57970.1 hypothetical protein GCM10010213_19370 [Microbacterium liquefaciens]
MSRVSFIDTTVLCNLVPVPGRDQNADEVRREMKERLARGERFILPITSVVETGNFIAQVSDGQLRRQTAEKLAAILNLICEGKAPWVLHDVAWDRAFLKTLLDGADTMSSYVEHAVNKVGAGDLCIITERFYFQERSSVRAGIWTFDAGLRAHA